MVGLAKEYTIRPAESAEARKVARKANLSSQLKLAGLQTGVALAPTAAGVVISVASGGVAAPVVFGGLVSLGFALSGGVHRFFYERSIETRKSFVADKDGKAVGHIRIAIAKPDEGRRLVHFESVGVLKGHRERGVATKLALHAAKHVEGLAAADPANEYYVRASLAMHSGSRKLKGIFAKYSDAAKREMRVGSQEWKAAMSELREKASARDSE